MTDLQLKKSLLSCPGDTIQEHIENIGMSQVELAERLGRSVPKLNELIKGKAPITKETAAKLEYVLNISASFWLNLEHEYQEELLEIEKLKQLENNKEWINKFPLSAMKRIGILPNTSNKLELTDKLLKFFRVASPVQWSNLYEENSLAFKIDLKYTAEPEAISVWVRLGEIQSEHIKVALFDKKALRENLAKIQIISYNHSDNWLEELQHVCAACGVALVYTPCISKAPIYGATHWIKNNIIPLIQVTDRRKDYNAFWFTFYHELAHVLYHGKKELFIHGLESIKPDKDKEDKADAFAARMLLSEKERNEVFQNQSFDKNLILKLSKKFKKHPSIIVSQVQREDNRLYKNAQLNTLKTKVIFDNLAFKS